MLYLIKEIAEKFRMSEHAVRRAIKAGDIQAIKIGGGWRIPQSEVDRILSGGRSGSQKDTHLGAD